MSCSVFEPGDDFLDLFGQLEEVVAVFELLVLGELLGIVVDFWVILQGEYLVMDDEHVEVVDQYDQLLVAVVGKVRQGLFPVGVQKHFLLYEID